MCTYKRISAKESHIPAKEPHYAPWGGVMKCLQVCVHVWCITVCLPICLTKCPIWKFDAIKKSPAPPQRSPVPLCTSMRSVTWPIHMEKSFIHARDMTHWHERHDSRARMCALSCALPLQRERDLFWNARTRSRARVSCHWVFVSLHICGSFLYT